MKLLDEVKVINDREEYAKEQVFSGMIGTIIDADIRWNSFFVVFTDPKTKEPNFDFEKDDFHEDICCGIKIIDLELVRDGNCDDNCIRASLPENHKDWWCKVEDGFIVNLKGEKKNKIPYDYNS